MLRRLHHGFFCCASLDALACFFMLRHHDCRKHDFHPTSKAHTVIVAWDQLLYIPRVEVLPLISITHLPLIAYREEASHPGNFHRRAEMAQPKCRSCGETLDSYVFAYWGILDWMFADILQERLYYVKSDEKMTKIPFLNYWWVFFPRALWFWSWFLEDVERGGGSVTVFCPHCGGEACTFKKHHIVSDLMSVGGGTILHLKGTPLGLSFKHVYFILERTTLADIKGGPCGGDLVKEVVHDLIKSESFKKH